MLEYIAEFSNVKKKKNSEPLLILGWGTNYRLNIRPHIIGNQEYLCIHYIAFLKKDIGTLQPQLIHTSYDPGEIVHNILSDRNIKYVPITEEILQSIRNMHPVLDQTSWKVWCTGSDITGHEWEGMGDVTHALSFWAHLCVCTVGSYASYSVCP